VHLNFPFLRNMRPRRIWEDSMKIDLGEIGLGGIDWIKPAQDRDQWRALLNTLMNFRGR
jgi:hypothetical protein